MDEGENQPQSSEPPQTGWQFHADAQPESNVPGSPQNTPEVEGLDWTASEFVEHSKSAGWYLMLAAGGLLLAGLVYLITKDKISTGMVVIVSIIFGIFAARKPRVLNYSVDQKGIRVGEKSYSYAHFKSFAVVKEGAIDSIWLTPVKRFMPMLTIYFEPNDESKIVDVISHFLPVEAHQLDPVDKLMHRLRF